MHVCPPWFGYRAMVKSGLRICGSADVDIDKLKLNFIFRLRASVRVRVGVRVRVSIVSLPTLPYVTVPHPAHRSTLVPT